MDKQVLKQVLLTTRNWSKKLRRYLVRMIWMSRDYLSSTYQKIYLLRLRNITDAQGQIEVIPCWEWLIQDSGCRRCE